MTEEVIAETIGGELITIHDEGRKLTETGKRFFDVPPSVQLLADVTNNAEYLFSMHPAPWGFYARDIDGYVVDANGKHIFGGEYCEGYVSTADKDIVALVDVINSLWRYMKGEN